MAAPRHPRTQFLLTPVRLLDLFKPVLAFLPEVEAPLDSVSLDEKVLFTLGCGFLFTLSQIPLYGLTKDAGLSMADPFPTLRPVFAMEQGTLLELGLLPALTAAFVWQLAATLRRLKVNFKYAEDRELFQTAQKVLAMLLGVALAAGLAASGYYDAVLASPSVGSKALLVVQVSGWNALCVLMLEVLDKGYGFGLGVLCFVALHSATRLVRDVIGLETVLGADGETQTYGVLPNMIKYLFVLDFPAAKTALVQVLTRSGYPSLGMVVLAVALGLAAISLQNYRAALPIRSSKARGTANVYPVRLLYTGGLPLLFALTVLANAQLWTHFAAAAVAPYYPKVATFLESRDAQGSLVSGVAFYLTAPASLSASVLAPLRAVVYPAAVLLLAVPFGVFWADVSGSAPKDIAQQFKEQSIIIAGKRDVSVSKELSRIVPVAAATGAFALAALALAGDLAGGAGKTTSVILGVCAAFAVLEDFMADFQRSGSSLQLLRAFAGGK